MKKVGFGVLCFCVSQVALGAETAPDPAVTFLQSTLNAKLDAFSAAALDAMDPSHLAKTTAAIRALESTKAYRDCIRKPWFRTKRHQVKACIALGEALKSKADGLDQEIAPLDQAAQARLAEIHAVAAATADADRAEMAYDVSAIASKSLEDAQQKLKADSQTILDSIKADCVADDLGASEKCTMDRAVRAFAQDLPQAQKAAQESFTAALAEARARVADYAEIPEPCGLEGTIAARVASCAGLSDSLRWYESPETGKAFAWKRVARSRVGHQLWLDEATGQVWTDTLPDKQVAQSYAVMSCFSGQLGAAEKARLDVRFSLPTIEDYETAYRHGLLAVTGHAEETYWTSTAADVNPFESSYNTFYAGTHAWSDGEQDLHQRISDRIENWGANVRCVAGY